MAIADNTTGLQEILATVNALPGQADTLEAENTLKSFLVDNGVIVPDGTKLNGLVALLNEITPSNGESEQLKGLVERNATEMHLPDGIETIGKYSFSEMGSLVSLVLPNTVKQICNSAFYNATALTSIEFPASVEKIERLSFYYCTALAVATFRGTPTTIESNTFYGCSNLKYIYCPWAEGAVSGAPWGATSATVTYNYIAEG